MVSKDKNLDVVGFLEPFYHRQWGVENRKLCGDLEDIITFHQLQPIFKYILAKKGRKSSQDLLLKQLHKKREDDNYLQIFSE